MEKSKERCVAEAMITEYLKMKKGEYLAITADQGSNFPQLEAYLDVCHEKGIQCTILKTATPPGQSKAAEETVPVDATREFLMNVDCWIDAGSKGLLYGDIYEYIMENNKKMRYMLTINLTTDLLYEMYCSFHAEKMVELTNLMKKRYNAAKTVTVRNKDGMDINFEVDTSNFIAMDNGDAKRSRYVYATGRYKLHSETGNRQWNHRVQSYLCSCTRAGYAFRRTGLHSC